MQFRDNLEIPGGNTRQQIKVEVGLGYCSAEEQWLNLHEKWYLKENMVRTTIAKDQFTDTKGYYIKEIAIITRSSHDRIYIVPMGMNTKVQGRLPLPQCITFHSLLIFDGVVVLKFYLVNHQENMIRENFLTVLPGPSRNTTFDDELSLRRSSSSY